MSKECKHEWDDGERYKGPYSHGYGIICYVYKCKKCGETMEIEKDIL